MPQIIVVIAIVAVKVLAINAFVGALIILGAQILATALSAPKKASVAQRQAQALDLSLGETPRAAIFGRAATGGTLMGAWNDGNDNEFETMVISLADHECDAIESFFVNDKEYALTAQGAQTHADFQDGGSKLSIEYRLGVPNQTLAPIIANQGVAAGEFASTDKFAGLTYVVVRYQISEKVWKAGRPRFIWVLRGLKAYSARKDSTVPGGSGPHRWGDPTTYEWTENARDCHYNFVRGVWNYAASPPQLMVGPGKSAEEAPPEHVIADANLCDEAVPLKAGGTEPRYRASAVVRADEEWIDVEENFAAAMAGQLVERNGTIGVDPGAWKTPAFAFTDDDLLREGELRYQGKTTRDELINTVTARYVERTQLWEQASAPMRRVQADIDADGEVREQSLDLVFVTSNTQAQRIAEVTRRRARRQISAVVPLGPKYMLVECGDWGLWTSQRRFNGDTRSMEAHGVALDGEGRAQLVLKEIDSSVFDWNPEVDELDSGLAAFVPPTMPGDAALTGWTVVATTVTHSGSVRPAIKASWTPTQDFSAFFVIVEWRRAGTTDPVFSKQVLFTAGTVTVTDGLMAGATFEMRGQVRTFPERNSLSTAWTEVTLGGVADVTPTPQNLNNFPTFQAWAGALPDGFAETDNGTMAVTKNVADKVFGEFVLDMDATIAGATQIIEAAAGVNHPVPPDMEYVTIEWDVFLVSGDFQRAGVVWRALLPNFGNHHEWLVSFFVEHPSPTTGRRYKGARTVRRVVVGSPSGAPAGAQMSPRLNSAILSGSANTAKRIRWNRVAIRAATSQEIAALLVLRDEGGFRPRNVNGGVSGAFTVAPLTSVTPTQINIAAATWTGAGGETVSIPSGNVASLSNATKYWMFRDTVAATFVATSSFATATANLSDLTGRYLALGNATTQSGASEAGGIGFGGSTGAGGEVSNDVVPNMFPNYPGHAAAYAALGEGKIFTDTNASNAVRVTLNQEIRFEGSGGGASATSSPTNVAHPQNILAGQFLVLHCLASGAASVGVTTPAGWTLLSTVPNSTGTSKSFVFYKIATGSESGNLSVTHTGTDGFHARMYSFSRGRAIEASGTNFESTADTSVEAVNVTTLDSWRMACQCIALTTNTTIGPIIGESGADYTEAVAEYSSATGAVTGTLSLQVARVGVAAQAITGGAATAGVSVPDHVHGFAIVP